MSDPNQQYFDYLDGVRDSNGINMFAAPSLLREAYGMSKQEATAIVIKWTRTYKPEPANDV